MRIFFSLNSLFGDGHDTQPEGSNSNCHVRDLPAKPQPARAGWVRRAITGMIATWMACTVASARAETLPERHLYVSPIGSDRNDGSVGAPFRTIVAASQRAQPGTTVHVAPGTYAGGFTTTANGAAAAHILFVSDFKWGARIAGGGPASNASELGGGAGWWNRGNYVDIGGFEIDGSGSQAKSWNMGFYGSGSHTTFRGGKVHDILTDPTAYSNSEASAYGGAGVEMDGYNSGTDGSIIGNLIYRIGPPGVRSEHTHAIYQSMPGSIINNVVYEAAGYGISLWHGARDIIIVNNTIDHVRNGGILVGSGDSGSSPSTGDYVTVANNIITNARGGIDEEGTTGLHNVYANNLVYATSDWIIRLQHSLTASGTVTADPSFIDPRNHDFRIRSGSPAIGGSSPIGNSATDIDGNARSRDTPHDIGAYEALRH